MDGDPTVTFTPTKYDPVTGTEVEFKGSNAKQTTMHAEIEAMTSAKSTGVKGRRWIINHRRKEYMSITIIDADGKMYKFVGDDLKPIKDEGKGYKDALVITCSS